MSYSIITKPSFLSDLLNLNRDLQNRITTAIRELEISPDVPRGDTIKKLKHLEHQWRYRIGDYRLICYIDDKKHIVRVMHIGHRKDVYEILSLSLLLEE